MPRKELPIEWKMKRARGLMFNCWQTSWLSSQRFNDLQPCLARSSFTRFEKLLNFAAISSNASF